MGWGGRGQLIKAMGPDEDLEDGGGASWAGHLSRMSSCRECGGGQMGKLAWGEGRDPLNRREYSFGDLRAVVWLGMAGPHCREL